MHESRGEYAPHDCSVVIPFYNEAEGASTLLEELRGVMESQVLTYEVILVNDGSADATGAVLDQIAATWPQCRVIHFPRNHGQAAALFYGISTAIGAWIAILDGDGQNVPADIPKLLARREEADMIAGVRANRQDSTLRRTMSRIANGVRSRVLGDRVSDTGCALKVFRREVAQAFIPLRTLYSFMPALASGAGFRVIEMPVQHRPRLKGTSSYGLVAMLWRPLLDMFGVWWFIRRRCDGPAQLNQEIANRQSRA